MKKNQLKAIFNSEYLAQISTLITGSAFAQMIPLIASPLIARIYSPNDYAVLAAYSSITIILTIIATGSFDMAQMLDLNDVEAINTGSLALVTTLVISTVSLVCMLMFMTQISNLTGNNSVSFWLYFVPVTVFLTGLTQTFTLWNNRKKRYKRISIIRILNTAGTTVLMLLLGYIGYGGNGLIIATIIGQAIALILLFTLTIYDDISLMKYISTKLMINSFIRHKDFLKYNMPQGFLDGIRESSILIIISNFFGAYALSSFSFTKSIIIGPLQLIGNSVSQVYYERASSSFLKTGSINKITKKTYMGITAVVAPFLLIILLFGENIFSYVFGNRWSQAGMISQILAVWLFVRVTTSSISTIPIIIGKLKHNFFISIIFNLVPIIALLLASIKFNEFLLSLTVFTFIFTLLLLLVQAWYFRMIRTPQEKNK